jgi:hypothetical protein
MAPSPTLDGVLVRRLLILLAVLIVLTALAGSIAPVPGPPEQATPTPAATIPGTPQASVAANPDIPDVRASLSSSPSAPARRILARVGDQVAITVRSEAIDSVALGDLDTEPVEAGLPARFDILADETGSYPVILLQAQRRIGTLIVR